MDIEIKTLKKRHFDDFKKLNDKLIEFEQKNTICPFDEDDYEYTLDYFIDTNEEIKRFGAFDDGKLIGIIEYDLIEHLISGLYVEKDYRKNGIATSLIKRCVKYHKKHFKGEEIFISAFDYNERAKRLYEEIGFKKHKITYALF